VDSFREFEKAGGHYTWWSPMAGARSRNIGWRIDYFLLSSALRSKLQGAFIRRHVPGSDHCPVGIEIHEK
jgi:exodeoxyribonuclease-3